MNERHHSNINCHFVLIINKQENCMIRFVNINVFLWDIFYVKRLDFDGSHEYKVTKMWT